MTNNFRTRKPILISWTTQEIILHALFLLMCASPASCTTIISLKLVQYSNPLHRELSGRCCDLGCLKLLGIGVCDNHISLCLDNIESMSDSMDECSYYKMDDFNKSSDDFTFPSPIDSDNPNPIVFEAADYKGGFRLKLDVWDRDMITAHDHVDFYNKEIYVTPSRSSDSASTQYKTLLGQGSSETTIAVKVYCADNFYGIDCSVYCVARDSDFEGHYTCDPSTGSKICLPGYVGARCNEINECESSPCQNGGSCIDHLNYFPCECLKGTSGKRCETVLTVCYSNPCKNNATCEILVDGFSCKCAGGFEGEFCQTETDECKSNPCQNSGSCVDMINEFLCLCTSGYYGLLCETDHDDCASNPCSNGATCTDVLNGYICTCAPSWFFDVHCKVSLLYILLVAAGIILIIAYIFIRHQKKSSTDYQRLQV